MRQIISKVSDSGAVYLIATTMLLAVLLKNADLPVAVSYIALFFMVIVTFFFMPFRLLHPGITSNRLLSLLSSVLLGAVCGYSVLTVFAAEVQFQMVGSIITIANLLFAFYLWFRKDTAGKTSFLLHFLVATFLIGLVKFQY